MIIHLQSKKHKVEAALTALSILQKWQCWGNLLHK